MAFVLSDSSYVSSLLHSHHHGGLFIFGVLLGTREEKMEEKMDDKGKKEKRERRECVRVEESVGIGHGVVLSPLLEVAMEQVRAYAEEKGMEVVGCYVGNEARNDMSLSPLTEAIATQVYKQSKGSLLLLINNEKLQNGSFAFDAFNYNDGQSKWVSIPNIGKGNVNDLHASTSVMLRVISEGYSQKHSDFSDHLNDLSRDWFNEELLANIRQRFK